MFNHPTLGLVSFEGKSIHENVAIVKLAGTDCTTLASVHLLTPAT